MEKIYLKSIISPLAQNVAVYNKDFISAPALPFHGHRICVWWHHAESTSSSKLEIRDKLEHASKG